MTTPPRGSAGSARGRLAVLGERRRILQREPHDIDVPAAGADRSQGDRRVGLRVGGERAGELLECLDDLRQIGAGGEGLGLVDADVEREPARFGALRHRADAGRRSIGGLGGGFGRLGEARAGGGGTDGVQSCERHVVESLR